MFKEGDCGLDDKTRGFIENAFDWMIENLEIRDILRWVLDEYPIASREDFALGYTLGSLSRYAHIVVRQDKASKQYRKRQKQRDEEYEKEFGSKPPTIDTKTPIKPFRIRMTKKDTAEIRAMLGKRILKIKEAIHKGLNL